VDEVNIKNDNSVSRCADREFRLVEPKRVRTGAALGVGDSQIPNQRERDESVMFAQE
jgi:hypothetical protein